MKAVVQTLEQKNSLHRISCTNSGDGCLEQISFMFLSGWWIAGCSTQLTELSQEIQSHMIVHLLTSFSQGCRFISRIHSLSLFSTCVCLFCFLLKLDNIHKNNINLITTVKAKKNINIIWVCSNSTSHYLKLKLLIFFKAKNVFRVYFQSMHKVMVLVIISSIVPPSVG